MSLDLTEPGRHKREPHWRRYLSGDGRIDVVCVQDFDYFDYNTVRFVDREIFDEKAAAVAADINVGPLLSIIEDGTDREATAQALCILRAVLRQNGVAL
jgi:hypothetical protein